MLEMFMNEENSCVNEENEHDVSLKRSYLTDDTQMSFKRARFKELSILDNSTESYEAFNTSQMQQNKAI
jgi:hypothetical protein